MSKIMQVSSRLWQIEIGIVNVYLIKTHDGLVLVDAAWPNKADAIWEGVRQTGHDPADIKHLLLTHGHVDHAGSAAEISRRTGAKVYVHPADLGLTSHGEAGYDGIVVTPGIIPSLVFRWVIRPGGTKYEPFAVDKTLVDGEILPFANDIEVIHTPGHCAGHVSFLLPQDGVLIAGDICSNVMGLSYATINADRALARASILKVADYRFEQAVFGHGKPLKKRADQLLKDRFINTKLK
jgi:glyoxylase-like metal-dependent hydrolase (beta-lactamase superfamily II)